MERSVRKCQGSQGEGAQQYSWTQNRTIAANPTMIMAMIQPVAQAFEAEAARLNGKRKIMRPPAKRMTPMTRTCVSSHYQKSGLGTRLTIKLYGNMLESLRYIPSTAHSLVGHESGFLGFVEVQLQDCAQRDRHERCDDGKSPKSPSPASDIHFKSLGSSRPCKSSDHVWRGGEGKGEPTVSQACCVHCNDNIRIDSSGGPDRGKHLQIKSATVFHAWKRLCLSHPSCAKCWQIRSRGLQDHSHSEHAHHEHEAFGSTPKIQTLR